MSGKLKLNCIQNIHVWGAGQEGWKYTQCTCRSKCPVVSSMFPHSCIQCTCKLYYFWYIYMQYIFYILYMCRVTKSLQVFLMSGRNCIMLLEFMLDFLLKVNYTTLHKFIIITITTNQYFWYLNIYLHVHVP